MSKKQRIGIYFLLGAIGWSRYGTDGAAIIGTLAGFGVAALYLFWLGKRKKDSIPFISRVL